MRIKVGDGIATFSQGKVIKSTPIEIGRRDN